MTPIEEHVNGFPERNAKLEKRLAGIEETIKEGLLHPKASPQTIAMVGDVKDLLIEHIQRHDSDQEGAEQWRSETDRAIQQLNELVPIIKEKLIPAYEREVNAENARRWLKEQAKSGSFWISVVMSIAGLFYGILFVIKQFLKP